MRHVNAQSYKDPATGQEYWEGHCDDCGQFAEIFVHRDGKEYCFLCFKFVEKK